MPFDMSAASPVAQRELLRRRSSVLQKAIQGRRSFRDLSARAVQLEWGRIDSFSAESIATFFLTKQQEDVESRLREQVRLRRSTFRHLVHLLRFSAYCTWRSSLLCGSLFKNFLDAKSSISRIDIILNSPSCHSQIRDLLLALGELHELFSDNAIDRIRHAKLLLLDLEADLTEYVEKARVRALSGMSAVRRKTKLAVKFWTSPPKSLISSLLFACGGSNVQETGNLPLMDVADDLVLTGDTPKDACLTTRDVLNVPGTPSGVLETPRDASDILSSSGQSSRLNAFSSLHKLHVQVHQLQVSIHAVIVMFDTLVPLLSGTHNQGVGQHLMDILKDDPLMFDGVSQQIGDCHSRLSTHLDDVREQLLICFCYINNARDLAYAL